AIRCSKKTPHLATRITTRLGSRRADPRPGPARTELTSPVPGGAHGQPALPGSAPDSPLQGTPLTREELGPLRRHLGVDPGHHIPQLAPHPFRQVLAFPPPHGVEAGPSHLVLLNPLPGEGAVADIF